MTTVTLEVYKGESLDQPLFQKSATSLEDTRAILREAQQAISQNDGQETSWPLEELSAGLEITLIAGNFISGNCLDLTHLETLRKEERNLRKAKVERPNGNEYVFVARRTID